MLKAGFQIEGRQDEHYLDVVPNLRQRVEREIEEELKIVLSQSQTSNGANQSYHPYLSQYPEPQQSSSKEIHHPLLRVSLPRLSNNRNEGNSDRDNEIREGLDVERFNIPYPNDPTDLEAWERALSNAKAQLEHQKLRSLNLSLMSNYGSNHWKLSNFLIEKEIEKVEKTVEAYKLEIDNVNRRRKASQVS
ncbi:Pre-mRNA-splicing factor SPF27 [Phakopsora pachyrhizi]|nr:Pre-mRNA-splicing factor SPF27 [Phakopsora pachyrhizi]